MMSGRLDARFLNGILERIANTHSTEPFRSSDDIIHDVKTLPHPVGAALALERPAPDVPAAPRRSVA